MSGSIPKSPWWCPASRRSCLCASTPVSSCPWSTTVVVSSGSQSPASQPACRVCASQTCDGRRRTPSCHHLVVTSQAVTSQVIVSSVARCLAWSIPVTYPAGSTAPASVLWCRSTLPHQARCPASSCASPRQASSSRCGLHRCSSCRVCSSWSFHQETRACSTLPHPRCRSCRSWSRWCPASQVSLRDGCRHRCRECPSHPCHRRAGCGCRRDSQHRRDTGPMCTTPGAQPPMPDRCRQG